MAEAAFRLDSSIAPNDAVGYNRMAMKAPPLLFVYAGLAFLLMAGCADLPNDVGVRQHRAIFQQASQSASPRSSAWDDDPTVQGKSRILVNLTTQRAFFFRGDTLIGRTSISSGRREFETPPGKYRVTQKDANHLSSQYGQYVSASGTVVNRDVDVNRDPMPAGARFVGASMPFFLRFRDGYGMHAGFVPRFRASHGCVRVPVKMAQLFFEAAELGTAVEVVEPPLMVER